MTMAIDVNFDHLTEVVFVRLFHCKCYSFPLSSKLSFLEESYYKQHKIKGWGVTLNLTEARVPTKIIWNPSEQEICPLVVYLFNHFLYQY